MSKYAHFHPKLCPAGVIDLASETNVGRIWHCVWPSTIWHPSRHPKMTSQPYISHVFMVHRRLSWGTESMFCRYGHRNLSPTPHVQPPPEVRMRSKCGRFTWFCMGLRLFRDGSGRGCWQRTASKLGSSNTCPIPVRGQIMIKIWSFHMVLHGPETVLRGVWDWCWQRMASKLVSHTSCPTPTRGQNEVKMWSKYDDFTCFCMVWHGFEMVLRSTLAEIGIETRVEHPCPIPHPRSNHGQNVMILAVFTWFCMVLRGVWHVVLAEMGLKSLSNDHSTP